MTIQPSPAWLAGLLACTVATTAARAATVEVYAYLGEDEAALHYAGRVVRRSGGSITLPPGEPGENIVRVRLPAHDATVSGGTPG